MKKAAYLGGKNALSSRECGRDPQAALVELGGDALGFADAAAKCA
jgi:hypothetical protein